MRNNTTKEVANGGQQCHFYTRLNWRMWKPNGSVVSDSGWLSHPVGGAVQLGPVPHLVCLWGRQRSALLDLGYRGVETGELALPMGRLTPWQKRHSGLAMAFSVANSCPWSCRPAQLLLRVLKPQINKMMDICEICTVYIFQVYLLMSLYLPGNHN